MTIPDKRQTSKFTRRGLLAGLGAATLTGCASTEPVFVGYFRPRGNPFLQQWDNPFARRQVEPQPEPQFGYEQMYGAMFDEGFEIPAVDLSRVDPAYLRTEVFYDTPERVGTVIVDTANRHLYLVREGGRAIRYGVGIGREGFAWNGRAVIQWKQKWPRWKVPDEMIARQPELAKYSVENGGKDPGLDNPLGARALYIFQNGEDTLYRIHGTPEYWTIGRAVSSGCVRMMNQDVIDLFDRVPNRTPIVVL